MQSTILATLAATGFTVAFFHAAIPTHWLPFVLVAQARRWSRSKALGVMLLAGLGHVGLTSLLGLAIAAAGSKVEGLSTRWFAWASGAVLLGVALYYFWRQWRGLGICHHPVAGGTHHANPECGHEHGHSHWDDELKGSPLVSGGAGDWAAIGGLFMMLTLSPCEAFLPIYLLGVQFGWTGFFVLSGILAVATLLGMALFTWLALLGLGRFKIQSFERYEAALLGTVFTVLALVVLTLER